MVAATGNIITIAGNGTAGYSGDGGPATAAEIDSPRGLAVDSAGNVFFADNPNNRIREVVEATGKIITVAGDGTAGYSGNNGPATAAELNGPNSVAVDSAGDLFIGDANNNAVREVVKATGNIIAFAGTGKPVTAATTDPRPPPSFPTPSASPSTPLATCSSPTMPTTWSGRSSTQLATSSPSPVTAPPVTAATMAPRLPPSSTTPAASPSIPRATCSSPTKTITSSARSRRR